MKVTQEKLPASQIGLEIEIPAEMSQKTYEKVIKDLSNTAAIPGFRKGKAPRAILIQRLGQTRINGNVLEELIQTCLQKALEQESINALGNFQLRSSFEELLTQFKPGQPLTFTAVVDVPPEIKIGEYKSLNVKAEEVTYDPTQVDKFLEERQLEKSTLIPVEGRAAKMGDVAVVDYTGRFIAGEGEESQPSEIPGAQATDFQMELGEGRFLEDIINGVVGMNPGETKELTVNFPEDYPREDLAGEATQFTITVKEIKEKELPALDDDFAKEVSEFETLDELRSSLEKQFQDKAEQATKSNKEQAVLAELVKLVDVDLPETMIDRESDTMLRQTVMQMAQMGMDVKNVLTQEMVQQLKVRSRPEAIDRIKKTLALQEVAKLESVQVEPEALENRIKEVREELGDQSIDQARLRQVVEADLLQEKALSWLTERATIELVPEGSLKETAESDDTTLEVETSAPDSEESTEG